MTIIISVALAVWLTRVLDRIVPRKQLRAKVVKADDIEAKGIYKIV